MRAVTVVALVLLVVAFGGAAGFALTDGFGTAPATDSLSVTWSGDTQVPSENNHHEVAVGRVGEGDVRAFAPVSSTGAVDACALVALDADTGTEAWRDPVPSANCTIHAVADPTVADYDRDGTTEVLATTTERVVVAYTPGGDVERRWNLSSYGYTKPIVADVTGDAAPEVVVVDARGLLQVLDADGGVAWRVDRDGYVWGTPVVDDVDDDGTTEVVVAGSTGTITAYAADGSTDWETDLDDAAVTWLTSADTDDDPAIEFYAGTPSGRVFAVDGTGDREWTTARADLSATGAVVSDDRGVGVFVTAADGTVARLDADTGDTVWETTVARDAVQMMPPPVAGDVDGDHTDEVVVAANDGTVAILDPSDGSTIETHASDARVLAAPVLADVDHDGTSEIFVIHADGTVQRLDYERAE